nr:integrase, catalytic region, zinc finger, CCHC-type, peptidase aspartic, catalytic [Tanacetum cinerariifolium]
VIPTTSVSRPQLKSNPQRDRFMHNNSQGKKQEVEDQRRNVKLSNNKTSVTACNDSLNANTLNVKSVCATCDTCVLNDKHDMCVLNSVAKPIKRTVASESNKKPRNFTRKLYERVRAVTIKRVYYVEGLNHNLFFVGQFCDGDLEVAFWKSTCFIRDLKGNDLLTGSHGTDLYSITLQDINCPNPICLIAKATSSQAWLWHRQGINHQTFVDRTPEQNSVVERRNRTLVEAARTMLSAAKVPLFFWDEAIATACITQNHRTVTMSNELDLLFSLMFDELLNGTSKLIEIVLFIVDSGCSKHMTGNLKLLINFVEKFLRTVKFGNDQIAPILGYGYLVQGAVTIKRVYYIEGLNHNLFSVGQFCFADLEVAFRKSTCFIRDLKGNDLLT